MAFSTIIRRTTSSIRPRTIISILKNVNTTSRLSHELPPKAFVPTLHFSSSSSSSSSLAEKPNPDLSLVRVINKEIKCAQGSDDHDRVKEAPKGFPFEIEDNPGQQTLILKRKYEDEVIKVEVYMPDLVTGNEEDNDDDGQPSQTNVPLVVTVSKGSGGVCLEFGVTAYPCEISIDSFSVKKSDTSEEEIPYEGPDFSSLDENLQKGFKKYLEIRGIRPLTTNFLFECMINKDSREFLIWLKKLKKFIEK